MASKDLLTGDSIRKSADVLDMVLGRVRDHPLVTAVDDMNGECSYEELAHLAFQIAATIRRVNENPCPRILVALPPSRRAYAAMVGALFVGGTFCPMHLSWPAGRNEGICEAFSPDVVLFEKSVPSFVSVLPVTTPRLDLLKQVSEDELRPSHERSDVAYVVFTSGSTGHPKGVKVGRQGFSHFLAVAKNYFNLSPGERWGQFSNLGHDLGVMDVFMALTQGGTLVPLSEAERRVRQGVAIRDKRVAARQLEEIFIYSEENWGRKTAEEYLAEFEKRFLDLRNNKLLGRARPELGAGYRSLPQGSACDLLQGRERQRADPRCAAWETWMCTGGSRERARREL